MSLNPISSQSFTVLLFIYTLSDGFARFGGGPVCYTASAQCHLKLRTYRTPCTKRKTASETCSFLFLCLCLLELIWILF